ncbi:MAG: hypothetical protein HGA84_04955 [Syntrophobacteraceae bacterium]|nr:hypothetical protein [Syntrophobacteraceae bacterium]
MTSSLYDSIARIARHESGARPVAGVGKVVEVHDGTQQDHAVTVEMRDTGLVLPRVPVAVGVMGYAAIPAVDDLVAVVFMEGDIHGPVVLGRLYHAEQPPPQHREGQIVLHVPRDDPRIKLDIEGKTPQITLTMGSDVKLEIVKDGATVEVGKMKVVVTGAGGGRVEISSGSSSMVLKQDGDITLKTQGKLKLEGSEVEISGTGKVKVSGAQVEIN